eukprot:EG_transcript_15966
MLGAHGGELQNVGNQLSNKSCVRQSKYYRQYESGNAIKALLGHDQLLWDVNHRQGVWDGMPVTGADAALRPAASRPAPRARSASRPPPPKAVQRGPIQQAPPPYHVPILAPSKTPAAVNRMLSYMDVENEPPHYGHVPQQPPEYPTRIAQPLKQLEPRAPPYEPQMTRVRPSAAPEGSRWHLENDARDRQRVLADARAEVSHRHPSPSPLAERRGYSPPEYDARPGPRSATPAAAGWEARQRAAQQRQSQLFGAGGSVSGVGGPPPGPAVSSRRW